MSHVLDASALLAYLHQEPGVERVQAILSDACISSVNWSEVVQKSLARGADVQGMREEFMEIGLTLEPFTPLQAEGAAWLWPETRDLGLSLADRACLALALDKSLPVLTTDRAWQQLKLDLNIQVVR